MEKDKPRRRKRKPLSKDIKACRSRRYYYEGKDLQKKFLELNGPVVVTFDPTIIKKDFIK